MSSKKELEVIEINIGLVDIEFHKPGNGNFSGDVVRNYLWDIYGPGIDTDAVVSVDIPELRYDTNEPLMIKVTQEKREFVPEYDWVPSTYKDIRIGDTQILFYEYDGSRANHGAEVKSFMWQISGAGIDAARIKGVVIPKLQKKYPEAIRLQLDFECKER